jgi:hypothetical protein
MEAFKKATKYFIINFLFSDWWNHVSFPRTIIDAATHGQA